MAMGIVVWIGFHQNGFTADWSRTASDRGQADWNPESTPLCMSSLSPKHYSHCQGKNEGSPARIQRNLSMKHSNLLLCMLHRNGSKYGIHV